MRNYLKILVLILHISTFSSAQIQKVEIPFVLMNQYFNFEILDSNILKLAQFEITPQLFLEKRTTKQIKINSKAYTQFDKEVIFKYFFYNTELPLSEQKYQDLITGQRIIKLTNNSLPFCLRAEGFHTKLTICTTAEKNKVALEAPPKISIDQNSIAEKSGSVILKDNLEPIVLRAEYNENNFIILETKKKSFSLLNVNKDEGANSVTARFYDLATKYSWTQPMPIDQDSFTIPIDGILDVTQDYFIKNKTLLLKTNVAAVYAPEPKKFLIAKHKKGMNALLGYSKWSGQNSRVNAIILSDLAMGMRFFYQKNLANDLEAVYSGGFLATSIKSDPVSTPIANSSNLLYNAYAGVKYHKLDNIVFTGEVGVSKQLYFENETGTEVSIKDEHNLSLSIVPEFVLYESRGLNLYLPISIRYLIPAQLKTSELKYGTQFETELKSNYRLGWGRVFTSIAYGTRSQGYKDISVKEEFYTATLGLYYLY